MAGPRSEPPTRPSFGDGARERGGVILVVDDDPSLRRMVRTSLDRAGHQVIEAAGGREAIDTLEQEKVDLILLDVTMPDVDGIEVCTEIRRTRGSLELPIIFLTGSDDRNTRLWCKAVGGDEFLGKPLDEAELLIRVGNLLRMRRLHRRLKRTNAELERRLIERPDVTDGELRERLARVQEREERVEAELERILGRAAASLTLRRRGGAVDRTSAFAELVAELAGLDDTTCDRVRRASALRDVGMLSVPDDVLDKPGSLDDTERAVMERHADAGAWILADSTLPVLALAGSIARSHHERWDGSGYPEGLAGKAIPLEGRIVAIADALDAMLSERPHRPARELSDALRELADGAGDAFDPNLLLALLEAEDRVRAVDARFRPRDP